MPKPKVVEKKEEREPVEKEPVKTTELTEELIKAGFNPDLPENKQREYR